MVMMFFRCKDTLFSHENFVENLREYFRDVSLFPHCFRNIIDFGIAKRRGRDEMDENWLAARAGLRMACGQKSEKIYLENLRKYFRIVSVVSALFSQFRIRREGRAGVNRQNQIFLLAYARRYD